MKKETVTLGSESHPSTLSGQYSPHISGHPRSQERERKKPTQNQVCFHAELKVTEVTEGLCGYYNLHMAIRHGGNVEQWLLFTHEDREQWCVSIQCAVRRVTYIWAVVESSLAIKSSLILQQIFPDQNWLCSFFCSARITWCARLSVAASTYFEIDYIERASSVEKFNLLAINSKDIFLREKNFSSLERLRKF